MFKVSKLYANEIRKFSRRAVKGFSVKAVKISEKKFLVL
jgi:hypothetical protein